MNISIAIYLYIYRYLDRDGVETTGTLNMRKRRATIIIIIGVLSLSMFIALSWRLPPLPYKQFIRLFDVSCEGNVERRQYSIMNANEQRECFSGRIYIETCMTTMMRRRMRMILMILMRMRRYDTKRIVRYERGTTLVVVRPKYHGTGPDERPYDNTRVSNIRTILIRSHEHKHEHDDENDDTMCVLTHTRDGVSRKRVTNTRESYSLTTTTITTRTCVAPHNIQLC